MIFLSAWDRPLNSQELAKARTLLAEGVHWKKIGPIIGATNPSVASSLRSEIARISQKQRASKRATVVFLSQKEAPAGVLTSFDAMAGVIKKPKTSFEVAVRRKLTRVTEKKKG